ncbi:hypothetical protein Dsin_026240 [Dipteronia sinensis]|uniref:F-box domain-containing protein n=1 Tax=Dipteronia sinensis TaxID=43782 RepID=A0AAD9ZX67_9ROSI|nr:hypothetical protein Dsin_026240 [Dipteronia sinensis]
MNKELITKAMQYLIQQIRETILLAIFFFGLVAKVIYVNRFSQSSRKNAVNEIKLGAFIPSYSIQPVMARYLHIHFDQSWGNISLAKIMFRMFTQFYNFIEVEYLPVVFPSNNQKENALHFAEKVDRESGYKPVFQNLPTRAADAKCIVGSLDNMFWRRSSFLTAKAASIFILNNYKSSGIWPIFIFTQKIVVERDRKHIVEEEDGCCFSFGNGDLLQNILSKLQAIHFASAARVSKFWNKVCNLILYRPKLATALLLSSSLQFAIQEVLDKVLSEPICPHFTIAYVGFHYNLGAIHRLITLKLGSQIPIITSALDGMIGIDTRTVEVKGARWDLLEEKVHVPNNFGGLGNAVNYTNYCGIILVVGFVPGFKVKTIPLLQQKKDYRVDLKPILVQMVVVGDASSPFLFNSGNNSQNYQGNLYSIDAVALVFAKDSSSNVGGQIQFQLRQANGLLPFDPQLKVASVYVEEERHRSWLTASMIGHPENLLDTRGLLQDIPATDDTNRKMLQRYSEAGCDGFVVDGVGIKPSDPFVFYRMDANMTFSSMNHAYEELKTLKTNCNHDGKEVIGSLIFSCCSRGVPQLPITESKPFYRNFAKVLLAGLFCSEEIARVTKSLIKVYGEDGDGEGGCFLHHHSTTCLVMIYTPR